MALLLRLYNITSTGGFTPGGLIGANALESSTATGLATPIKGIVSPYAFAGKSSVWLKPSILSDLFNTKNQSIAFWLNPQTSAGEEKCVFGEWLMHNPDIRGYCFYIYPTSGNLHLPYQENINSPSQYTEYGTSYTGTLSGILTANTWQHLCLTMDNGQMKVYVNGVLKYTQDRSHWVHHNWTAHTRFPLISCWGTNEGNNLGNYMDDVRIYNHPLSQDEIDFLVKAPHFYLPIKYSGTNYIDNKWGETNLSGSLGDVAYTAGTPPITQDVNAPMNGAYFTLNGIDQHIMINSFLCPGIHKTQHITVNLWAYMDNWYNMSSGKILLSACPTTSGIGCGFQLISTGTHIYYYYSFLTSSSSSGQIAQLSYLSSGWHMFTITLGNGYARYLDGALVASGSLGISGAVNYAQPNYSITIGGPSAPSGETSDGSSSTNFAGRICGCTIYGRMLTQAQITELYNRKISFTKDYAVKARSGLCQ